MEGHKLVHASHFNDRPRWIGGPCHKPSCDCKGKEKEGKGYIAVPACGGSLAEAKCACNQT
eukprot:scaffold255037_cov20-Tisochrysis_lutea.AAC.1